MSIYRTPGVYREAQSPELIREQQTGVPLFLGLARSGAVTTGERQGEPACFTAWPQFESKHGQLRSDGYLFAAVRGFFQNGGRLCYVQLVPWDADTPAPLAWQSELDRLAWFDAADLLCAPDLMALHQQGELAAVDDLLRMQSALLHYCDATGDRFAILDSLPAAGLEQVQAQRQALAGTNGALYYPWLDTGARCPNGRPRYLPPCGHVVGVYARTDRRTGVHKAPANEVLEGVLDLEIDLTDAQQEKLNPQGINCLRPFPARGIRVWGARTLSQDRAWAYVSVRRLFLTVGRWIERNLAGVTFEPNNERTWRRIERELTAYFNGLLSRGALWGATPEQAFYVKCDAETNSAEVRELGRVVTEIGLAPAWPNEFVVVRVLHGAGGVTIAGPSRPESRR